MTTIASQITSLTIVYSTVYSDADQRKQQSSASLAFVWGIHRDRWIPRTKGQLRGKCFHLMTSSWYEFVIHAIDFSTCCSLICSVVIIKWNRNGFILYIQPYSMITAAPGDMFPSKLIQFGFRFIWLSNISKMLIIPHNLRWPTESDYSVDQFEWFRLINKRSKQPLG